MKIVTKNKRATFDYQIDDRLLAGVVLAGHEVKSVRNGDVSLKGSFANIHNGELWLTNCHIGPYKHANLKSYDPTHSRKLLVQKRQLKDLLAAKQNGRHIVPISIGIQRQYIKVELGIGASAKRGDKRQKIQKRDVDRETDRSMKQASRS